MSIEFLKKMLSCSQTIQTTGKSIPRMNIIHKTRHELQGFLFDTFYNQIFHQHESIHCFSTVFHSSSFMWRQSTSISSKRYWHFMNLVDSLDAFIQYSDSHCGGSQANKRHGVSFLIKITGNQIVFQFFKYPFGEAVFSKNE